jgi:hypothetical protein
MFVGILFTAVVSFAIAFFSIWIFFSERFAPSGRRTDATGAFALFWLGMGCAWITTAAIDIFGYLALPTLSIISTYALQVWVGGALIAAALFFNSVLFGSRYRRAWLVLYSVLYLLFLATLFGYGVRPSGTNFFVYQIVSAGPALTFFIIMVVPLWLFSAALFVKLLRGKWAQTLSSRNWRFFFFASVAFIAIGTAGSADEMGLISGWLVTASRLISLIAAIVAYIASLALHESDELVI